MNDQTISMSDLNDRITALEMAVSTLLTTTATFAKDPVALIEGYAEGVAPGKTINETGLTEGQRAALHKLYTRSINTLKSHPKFGG